MTAEDLLDAYRDEMAPTLGRAFIEGFIARNRSSMLRSLAPLVALMNERMQAPRASETRREEDPDAVTPEKDAIVWAAFMDLVEEKKRQLGIRSEESSAPPAKTRTPRARKRAHDPIDPESLKRAILHDSLSDSQRTALRNIILTDPAAALRVAAIGGHEASKYSAQSAASSLNQLGLNLDGGDLRHAWMVAMQAIDPMVAKTNTINQTDDLPSSVLEQIGLDHYEQQAWRRLFRDAADTAIEQVYRGSRPGLDLDAALWSKVVARQVALAALNMKPSLEELLPVGRDELSSGIKKWMAANVIESLPSCRSCQPSVRRIREAESLPSPKHAGHMGDGFKVGEHVIRIGDMIKMEGQLGGYVENVDRIRGTAKIEQDNGEIKTWPLASLLHDTKANRERQQEHNDQINAEAEQRLERSLANWRA